MMYSFIAKKPRKEDSTSGVIGCLGVISTPFVSLFLLGKYVVQCVVGGKPRAKEDNTNYSSLKCIRKQNLIYDFQSEPSFDVKKLISCATVTKKINQNIETEYRGRNPKASDKEVQEYMKKNCLPIWEIDDEVFKIIEKDSNGRNKVFSYKIENAGEGDCGLYAFLTVLFGITIQNKEFRIKAVNKLNEIISEAEVSNKLSDEDKTALNLLKDNIKDSKTGFDNFLIHTDRRVLMVALRKSFHHFIQKNYSTKDYDVRSFIKNGLVELSKSDPVSKENIVMQMRGIFHFIQKKNDVRSFTKDGLLELSKSCQFLEASIVMQMLEIFQLNVPVIDFHVHREAKNVVTNTEDFRDEKTNKLLRRKLSPEELEEKTKRIREARKESITNPDVLMVYSPKNSIYENKDMMIVRKSQHFNVISKKSMKQILDEASESSEVS